MEEREKGYGKDQLCLLRCSGHHLFVYRKKKRYREEQAKRRAIKKREEGDEHNQYDEPSGNEEGDSRTEDNSVNAMDEYFEEPVGNRRALADSCREDQ